MLNNFRNLKNLIQVLNRLSWTWFQSSWQVFHKFWLSSTIHMEMGKWQNDLQTHNFLLTATKTQMKWKCFCLHFSYLFGKFFFDEVTQPLNLPEFALFFFCKTLHLLTMLDKKTYSIGKKSDVYFEKSLIWQSNTNAT